MNLELDGRFRPDFALNGDSIVRFRPSGPTRRSLRRICPSECRSSFSVSSCGYSLAMSRKVSPSVASIPVAVCGQFQRMPWSARYLAKRPALNVVPWYTPYCWSTSWTRPSLISSQLLRIDSSVAVSMGIPARSIWATAIV